MFSESKPVSAEERVVAVTGRTIFERASDLISKVRSVEIASKYRSRPRSTSLANGPCSMFHRESLIEIGAGELTTLYPIIKKIQTVFYGLRVFIFLIFNF